MPSPVKWLTMLVACLVVGTTLQVGCTATDEAILAAIGGDCLINSDCQDGLICVFKRCHEQCNTSVDCPLDDDGEHERCMLGTKPDHYCQLDDERGCVYNSECPGDQICGNDGECRDECATDKDCVEDQQCAQASCALPSELDENGDLPMSTDAQEVPTGQSCLRDSDCTEIDDAFVCLPGGCNYECKADVDCESGRCNVADGAPGGRCAASTINCVPGAQVACDCVGGGVGAQICLADGTGYDVCKDQNGSCAPP